MEVLFEDIINFLFPAKGLCLFCWHEYSGTPDWKVCPQCTQEILNFSRVSKCCSLCGRYSTEESCPNCHGRGIPGVAGVISVVPYLGRNRELIQQLKYGDDQELSKPLGYLMGRRWRQAKPKLRPDVIIPVPLEPQRHKERGFNQSTLLGQTLSKILRLPMEEDYLLRSNRKASQASLGRRDRASNIRNAFCEGAIGKLTGKTVLLIDDIVTTGATLEACATILHKLEVKTVWGLTWAAGIRT